ncbi:MAG: hypothetical protein PHC88_03570 [Terrimicrobiaceae bacterium]|nr:hypothetical protein [Terrimicrobiaceae bacterium]
MKTSHPLQFIRVLGIAAALLTAANANAATINLAPFAGTYAGTYGAAGSILTFSGDSSGPSQAKFKASQANAAGKLNLSGTDTKNSGGGSYTAVIQFKKGGACTTDAIVPGIVKVAGTGTWKLSGKKITFTLTADVGVGVIVASGTLKLGGKKLNITSTGVLQSLFASGSGKYVFAGKK